MARVEDGKLIATDIEIDLYDGISHGVMQGVNAIVLHRTDSGNAESVLNAYKSGQQTGAHFLIAKDGRIIQTARIDRICWHVGILLPRCEATASCSPAEAKTLAALLYEKGVSFSQRARNVSRHETRKTYPARYPSNADSIGIEVVGRFQPGSEQFEAPTPHQTTATRRLVDLLTDHFGLSLKNDVYSHGRIARKQPSEGEQLLEALYAGMTG